MKWGAKCTKRELPEQMGVGSGQRTEDDVTLQGCESLRKELMKEWP